MLSKILFCQRVIPEIVKFFFFFWGGGGEGSLGKNGLNYQHYSAQYTNPLWNMGPKTQKSFSDILNLSQLPLPLNLAFDL